MPKPPPFHAVRSAVRARTIWRSATTVSRRGGSRRLLEDHHTISARHPLIVGRPTLAVDDAADTNRRTARWQCRNHNPGRWSDDRVDHRAARDDTGVVRPTL